MISCRVEANGAPVVVIGAGHNGLVAACYLARAGVDVLVLEAGDSIGGMTATAAVIPEAPEHLINEGALDCQFLRCSSVVTDLELPRFGFEEREVDPPYVSLDADGASLCVWRDPRRTAEEIRRFSRRDAEAFLELARIVDAGLDMTLPLMLTNPTRPAPRRVVAAGANLVRHSRALRPLGRLLTASILELVDERFTHPIVRVPAAVLPGVVPVGGDGSAFWAMAFAFIHRFGVSRIVGGTGALPRSLGRCLASAGGRVRTSAEVEEIVVRQGRVAAVRLTTGEELPARAVLASCDPRTTLTRLVPDGTFSDSLATRAAHIPTTAAKFTSLKVDVALRGRLDLPRHHAWRGDGVDLRVPVSMWTSPEELHQGFERSAAGMLPEPIPVLAAVPTAADPSQAPVGQDTLWAWSGWVPVEPNEPWDTLAEPAMKSIVADVSRYYDGIEELEIGRRVATPRDLERRFHAPGGNVYHVDIGPLRSGPLRPALGFAGYRTPLPGLFLTGAGTHPTPGIAGVPGQLAARTLLQSLKG